MKNIFIDSEVIPDLLSKREPHYQYAAQLFTLVDRQKVSAYTSPVVFANLHYLLSKMSSKDAALNNLRKLKTFVTVSPTDDRVIGQSLNSEFDDFGDAIQYFTAINNGIKQIIKRNTRDYRKSKISVLTAQEFVKNFLSVLKSAFIRFCDRFNPILPRIAPGRKNTKNFVRNCFFSDPRFYLQTISS